MRIRSAALHAPLDVFVMRKLGVPGYEELATVGDHSPGLARPRRRRSRECCPGYLLQPKEMMKYGCISGTVSTAVPTGLTKGKPPRKVGILPKIPHCTEVPDGIVPH